MDVDCMASCGGCCVCAAHILRRMPLDQPLTTVQGIAKTAFLEWRVVCLPVAVPVGGSLDGCPVVVVTGSQALDCTTSTALIPVIPWLALGGEVTLSDDVEMELVSTAPISETELDGKGSTTLDVSKLFMYS